MASLWAQLGQLYDEADVFGQFLPKLGDFFLSHWRRCCREISVFEKEAFAERSILWKRIKCSLLSSSGILLKENFKQCSLKGEENPLSDMQQFNLVLYT